MYDATENDNHKPRPQETLPIRDSVDKLTKSCVIERLADAARIDCAHGVVWAALLIAFDSMLHDQAAIKQDINERDLAGYRRQRQGQRIRAQ
jgi:hypothetical protein